MFADPPPAGQGYRMWPRGSKRNASFHPARLSLPRREVFVSGWALATLRARRLRTARLAGPWSLRLRAKSSSSVTSSGQMQTVLDGPMGTDDAQHLAAAVGPAHQEVTLDGFVLAALAG